MRHNVIELVNSVHSGQNIDIQRVFDTLDLIKKRIHDIPQVTRIDFAKTTSIDIYFSSDRHIVIEISIDAKIAAIFMYGCSNSEILSVINKIVLDSGLVILEYSERIELENSGIYDEIF
jgi:hypothetical protein